jgi:hypothetical protein
MSYTVPKDHLEDQSVDGRIILRWIFRKNIYICIYTVPHKVYVYTNINKKYIYIYIYV